MYQVPVSYTHLDVYKRQTLGHPGRGAMPTLPGPSSPQPLRRAGGIPGFGYIVCGHDPLPGRSLPP